MGNAQSAPDGQHHNRLSKPKTNTNSPYLHPNSVPDSPASASSRYVDLSARGRQQIKEQLLSPIESEFDCGASAEGDTKLGELAAQVQRRLSTISGSSSRPVSRSNSRTNSLSCFGSKQNSTTKLASLPGSKISLVSNSQAVDLETAIKILQEVRKSASPEDLEALHDALEVPANPVLNVPDQGLSRRTSVVNRSSSSLTRRRSLIATPGLATRNSLVEGHRRTWNSWKAPQLDPRDEAKWRKQDMVANFQLARVAALDLGEDGRNSPTPRARTPGELDYSHLGTFQLGSLVVTNGAASPAPSTGRLRQRRYRTGEEDYFTSLEGSSPLMMKRTRKRGHTRSKSAVSATTPPLYRNLRVSGEERLAKTMSRYDRSRKAGSEQPEAFFDLEPEPVKRLRVINKSVDTLSRGDEGDTAKRPSEDSHTRSSEDHDEGFASDDARAARRAVERMFDGTIFSEPPPMPESFSASQTVSVVDRLSIKQRKKRSERRPPPKKADSGYSSGGSLRTSNREMQKGSVPTLAQPSPSQSTPPQKPSTVPDVLPSGGSSGGDANSLYTFEQMLQLPMSQKPLPAIPVDDGIPPRPPSLKIPASDSESQSQEVMSPKTPVSIISKFSIDSNASSQKRLQKRCPSYQELPVVQSCQPIPEGTIPNVPKSIRAKFSRRLSETPGMEYLTRTYPSKDHVNADQSTIASSTVVPNENTSPELSHELTPASLELARPATPPTGSRRRLSLFRRSSTIEKKKEASREDENASPSIVHLGTIASALGRSPYDAAKPDVPAMLVTPPTHPHQISDALPRARSMVSMDSRTAAEFARMRSKDLATARPEIPRRPSSYHDLNLEAGEAIAFKRRPRSAFHDTPPVPFIEPGSINYPTAPQVAQEEETSSGARFRARSTGRGPVVSELVDKYDQYDGRFAQQQLDLEAQSRVWNSRRKSVEEGLHQHYDNSSPPDNHRSLSEPPDVVPSGGHGGAGVDYRYEHRRSSRSGAERRKLHSYTNPKSMHWRNWYPMEESDARA